MRRRRRWQNIEVCGEDVVFAGDCQAVRAVQRDTTQLADAIAKTLNRAIAANGRLPEKCEFCYHWQSSIVEGD